jgi:hypothetical protein
MLCDVENVANDVKPERLRKSDLVVLIEYCLFSEVSDASFILQYKKFVGRLITIAGSWATTSNSPSIHSRSVSEVCLAPFTSTCLGIRRAAPNALSSPGAYSFPEPAPYSCFVGMDLFYPLAVGMLIKSNPILERCCPVIWRT